MLENNQKELILLKDLGMIYPNENSKQKRRYGLYKCHCGNEFKTLIYYVKTKHTKSCGCNKNTTTHGLSNHPLYDTWNGMIQRCTNKNAQNYKDYGAREIIVCDKWLIIENFIEDMYSTYQEGLTLDRINHLGNYEPNNCRWITKNIQSRNTRKIYSNNTSGYRGVTLEKKVNLWRVQIRVNWKRVFIGHFNTALDGALAYDNYIIKNNLEHTKNFS